jgi:hypothetical protein
MQATITEIKIGRSIFDYNIFKNAVKSATRLKEVTKKLGLNPSVGTTNRNIEAKIKELGLDTSHFTYSYTKSEKFYDNRNTKQYNISPINLPYVKAMQNKFDPQSWNTYKCSLSNFLESIGEQDFATITPEQIERYTDKKNTISHIRSAMITAVKENVNGTMEKVSKSMLIWLI